MMNGHFYDILGRMKSNFIIGDISVTRWGTSLAREFYEEHEGKPFYEDLVEFTARGPIAAIALVGEDAVARWRRMIGATDPLNAVPGSLRRIYGHRATIDPNGPVMYNAVHGSDSVDSARREMNIIALGIAEYEALGFGQLAQAIIADPEKLGRRR
jgi:nucleoside-diphosphate kinase